MYGVWVIVKTKKKEGGREECERETIYMIICIYIYLSLIYNARRLMGDSSPFSSSSSDGGSFLEELPDFFPDFTRFSEEEKFSYLGIGLYCGL